MCKRQDSVILQCYQLNHTSQLVVKDSVKIFSDTNIMFLDDALTDQIHLQKTVVSKVCPEN